MKQILMTTLIGLAFGTGQTALAQSRCSEVFTQKFDFSNTLSENSSMAEFHEAKKEFKGSTTLTAANNAILNLVEMSNQIFDQAINLIIQVQFAKQTPEALAKKNYLIEHLIEELQQTYEIGNNTMTAAVKNRIAIELAELNAMAESQQKRRAIGFGRDQSAESFHEGSPNKEKIGFRTEQIEESDSIHPENPKHALGFNTKPIRETDLVIKELVEFEEVIAPATPQSIGYINQKEASQDVAAAPQPIGFVHFKLTSEKISPAKLHRIFFNIETGSFEFQKGEQ